MPELPEVETVKRGIETVLLKGKIKKVILNRKNLRVPFPENLPQKIEGAIVSRISRRSKYILIELDNSRALILHLGMSGRIRLCRPGANDPSQAHDHFILEMDNGAQMVLNDARRFGMVLLAENAHDLINHPAIMVLGVEPFSDALTPAYLMQKLKTKKASMKAVLMDQRVIAGLGNIYVNEALYYAGISPLRAAARLTAAEAENLIACIRAVLEKAIAAGGSTLRDHRMTDGTLGYFQHQLAVYDKEGNVCPVCQEKGRVDGCIKRLVQQGRATYYCSRRQK